jgi:hypothetical protein
MLVILTLNSGFDSQRYVTVKVERTSIQVESGKPFFIFVKIRPADGIHVNAQPPVSVKSLDSQTTLNIKAIPSSGDYLNPSKPIEIEGRVSGVGAGPHKISFIVDYTYCSEKDRWCRMGKDTVFVTIRLKK